MPTKISFQAVSLALTNRSELLDDISRGQTVRLATANPEFMVTASHRPDFAKALAQMTHVSIDGIGLLWALKLARQKSLIPPVVLERYPGVDCMHDLFSRFANSEKRFFLLGGQPGVAEKAGKLLQQQYPNLQIVGINDGGQIPDHKIVPDDRLLEQIKSAKPDILLVGFGAPKQELWIQAANHLPVQVIMGIGGSFDFLVKKKRAPSWLQKLHMEWFYRGLTESGHWPRVFRAVLVFPWQTLVWLLTADKAPQTDR